MSHQLHRAASTGAVAAAAALLTIAAAPAALAQPGAGGGDYTCSGGSWEAPETIPTGTYRSITVSGICLVTAPVTSSTNLTVRPGGVLVTVGPFEVKGNAIAQQGATMLLGLGCPEGTSCADTQKVGGNVIAQHSRTIDLLGTAVTGNLEVQGGGPGADCVPGDMPPIGYNLALKDNTIDGNVMINGWAGCWAGLIRNTIGGNVTYQNVTANLDAVTNPQGPDSNEIVANTIGGFLSCRANAPTPQYGDAGTPPYATNQARGFKGQCAAL